MSERDFESPFATPEGAEERIAMFDAAKTEAAKAGERFRQGITDEPQEGKRYMRLALPEGTKAVSLTFVSDHGGDTLDIQNGRLIEIDKKGVPVNPIIRDFLQRGEFPYTLTPEE